VSTGIRFFDHMLELFTRHGGFDLTLKCVGDLDVDQHHTVEDVGIALGEAFAEALGDKKGILRAGYFVMAMDETLAVCAVDLSGRTAYVVETLVDVPVVGDLQSELVADFFDGFARGAKANVHVKTMYGRSNHHKIEAIFKAFARAMRHACSRDERCGSCCRARRCYCEPNKELVACSRSKMQIERSLGCAYFREMLQSHGATRPGTCNRTKASSSNQ
jgi:imidazoleglycerol-phosphate dehydratase